MAYLSVPAAFESSGVCTGSSAPNSNESRLRLESSRSPLAAGVHDTNADRYLSYNKGIYINGYFSRPSDQFGFESQMASVIVYYTIITPLSMYTNV